ncbi:MAG: hypothetical protein B7X00_00105, partial [Legionella sp. 21-45-4]
MGKMIKWNFAWVCVVTSIAYAAESELSLSSLLQTHQSSSKIQAGDFLSFTFNGSSAGNINYLQLCTASSGTDCTTCNTNITPITSGTALPYASGGTTYGMNTSAIAAYLTQNSASSGTYYIGLYVQSQELACNSGASYCSSNADTAGGRLCFSVDYDASTPAASNLALVNNTGVAPLTTATAPIVLSAAGQTTPSQLISIDNQTGAPTYLTLPNVSLMNAVNCRNPGVICTAIGSNSSSNQVLYRSTSDQKVWTNAVTLSSGGVFHSTSCSVSGSSWYCTAVGRDSSNNPLLYTGTNASGSEVWSAISLTAPAGLASGDLKTTSCIGGNPITCVAAGQYSNGTSTYPLLYSGTYSSNAWVWTLVTTTSDTGVFNAASCSGSGAKPFCVAAGQDTTTNTPLLYLGTGFLTNSGGVVTGSLSWESVATTTNNALYNAASCAGASGASGTSSPNWNVVCAVAGVDTTAGNSLIYVGTGTNITSGTTPASFTAWTPVTTTTSGGTFEVIGCSHSSGTGTNSNY